MENSATSFPHLINFAKASIDYEDLLHGIFKKRTPHEKALAHLHKKDVFSGPEQVFGRDDEKKMLLSKLLNKDKNGIQLSAIPILGGCGIGKTTLSRLVYNDEEVNEHFELRAWVKVEGDEFRLHLAAQGILKSSMGMSCSVDDMDELDEMIRDILQSKRCLVVFDGVESMKEDSWLHMNHYWFAVVDLGSKVLITTPSKDVANLVAENPLELAQLSPSASLSLCRHLTSSSSEDVKVVSSLVAVKLQLLCQGIPLLLKLVVSLMRYDDKIRNHICSMDDDILSSSANETFVISLCVWALPQQIRECLVYCTLFPKGCAMDKVKIIRMWIADNIIKPSSRKNISLEDVGSAYFLLLCRSFFTDITYNEYGDILAFNLPRTIYKMAKDVATVVHKDKLGVIGSIAENAARLSLDVNLPFSENYNSNHLKTLVLSPTICLGGRLLHSLLEFKGLESLDLSCSGIRGLSENVCGLKELRYLNLSYTRIKTLPNCIGDLSKLLTLDLSWCYYLKFLPEGMGKLTQIRHFDLSRCESLSYLPSGIKFFTSLNSMPLFVLGNDHNCASLGELRNLNQLRGRLEIRNLENVRKVSTTKNPKLHQKNLHHLGLSWSETNKHNCYEVLNLLKPNENLKVLDLTNYMGFKFPQWIQSLNGLIKISINNCGCEKLPSLGNLPLLKELQLKCMKNITYIGPEFDGYHGADYEFPSLEKLGVYDLPNLSEWYCDSDYAFPSIKNLTIEDCPQLCRLPSLSTLNDLVIRNGNNEIIPYLSRSVKSISSLLIKDMELEEWSLFRLNTLTSLKKLILFNVKNIYIYERRDALTSLEHLGILHCHHLRELRLPLLSSLQKLHIIDCLNLDYIDVRHENPTLLELVVEDCPAHFRIDTSLFPSLRKLVIKNCGEFRIRGNFRDLEKLEYLFICGCPELESRLRWEPQDFSHIPCVILDNHKRTELNLSPSEREYDLRKKF